MPLSLPLADIQHDLKLLIQHDLKATLKKLQSLLPENTSKHDEIILLLARYNKVRSAERIGAIQNEEIRRMEN